MEHKINKILTSLNIIDYFFLELPGCVLMSSLGIGITMILFASKRKTKIRNNSEVRFPCVPE